MVGKTKDDTKDSDREFIVVDGKDIDGGTVRAYIDDHPESTIYHTEYWRKVLAKSFAYRSWLLVAVSPSGERIGGVLPLFLVRSPFCRRLVAVPFRDRGGPLWSCPEAFLALVKGAQSLAVTEGAGFLQLKNVKPYPAELVQAGDLQESWYWVNSIADLQGLNRELLWKKIGQKTRNMIRQAEQAQLMCRDVTDTDDGLTVWYNLHLATQKRLGIPPFPKKFFRNILTELNPEKAVKLFVVEGKQEPLAATIILLHGKTAIYGYSSSATTAQQWRPNDFMLFHVFDWLLTQGYREFDLGSDAPGQAGLLFFKKKWLARQRKIPVYTWGRYNQTLSDSSDPRYRHLRKILTHLPEPCLRLLGSAVTKFFG